ncbi:MAG: hypothetical protein ABIJ09_03665 [Pseudomonadota bacterium]
MTSERTQIFLSAAERAAGTVVEVEHGDEPVLVEVPAGTKKGAVLRVKRGDRVLEVEVAELEWGLDGGARLDLAPRQGSVQAERRFWERATEEIVESHRSKHEFAGSVYVEQRGDALVLTGLHRNAVGDPGRVQLDPAWGSLLWHTRPAVLSATTAFSDLDAELAKKSGRPVVTLCHTALSPSAAAALVFPVGVRTLMLAAGLKGLLAIDQKRKGSPMLLGRAVAARVIYPDGGVAPVEHAGASLPREVFDRAAFAVDKTLGKAEGRARRFLRDVIETTLTGKPPGA